MQLVVGELVEAGERSDEWPAFVFVVSSHGSGWVPARHLSGPSGQVQVQVPYDTTELLTAVGDVLEVLAEDGPSGWLWCRSHDGREGWVPLESVSSHQ